MGTFSWGSAQGWATRSLLSGAVLAVLASACSGTPGQGAGRAQTAAATAQKQEDQLTDSPRRTGNDGVDRALDAVESGDLQSLVGMVRYSRVGCSTRPGGGLPQPPACPSGTTDGTPVDVVLAMYCEGQYRSREAARDDLAELLAGDPQVYAVYSLKDPQTGEDRFWLVFGRGAPLQPTMTLAMGDEGVDSLIHYCDASPEQFAKAKDLRTVIAPP